VIATSDAPADDIVARVGARLGAPIVRGSEHDVLARFLLAAREHSADAVLRVTSDCPLLDPEESSRVVDAFLARRPDYASNVLERTLPRGLDTEVVTRAALERAADAASPEEREHVTLHLVRRPQEFRLCSVTSDRVCSHHRWTLDTLEDYQFLHALVSLLGHNADTASFADILRELDLHPHLVQINSRVEQKRV
jgi:spore coat polysaccharide biosynthesis protein SpsF